MADKYRAAIKAKAPAGAASLSRAELQSMVQMSEKTGDKTTAAKHQGLLDQVDKPVGKPAQMRSNKAHAKVRKATARLEKESATPACLLEKGGQSAGVGGRPSRGAGVRRGRARAGSG